MEELYGIPNTWAWTVLEEIGDVASGGTPKTSDTTNFDGEIAWVTPADLTGYKEKLISRGHRNISQKGLRTSSARILPKGTILFSSRAPIGYTAIAANELSTNQGFKNLIPHQELDNDYIYYYLRGNKRLAESLASGTTFSELSARRFAQIPIPLAPLNEQQRIVSKIEELFSDLDDGEAALKKTQKLIASYRQSVLKAAITGELTKDWREANKHRVESGAELLERILETRREQWRGRGKYEEPEDPDTTDLPEIPEGWVWKNPEQLAANIPNALCIGPFGSNLKVDDYRDSGVPLVFVRHIRAKRFDGLNAQFISREKARELSSHKVQGGDLLITKMGEPPGDVCVYPENREEAIITADCIRFSPARDYLSVYFLELAISSNPVQRQIQRITKGVAQQKVTLANFKKIAIPIPPTEEQHEIVNHVQEVFSRIDALEIWCKTELTRSARLRQSILKAAFSGQLVPQDPTDEPASELLKRIQAEREGLTDGKAQRTEQKRSPQQLELI